MFSIIICTRNLEKVELLKKNISETIGVESEFVVIDNTANKYSISQAYNIGIKKAKYDKLCFFHDDIKIKTLNWGTKVLKYFKNPQVGLLGVAGTNILSKCPQGWWLNTFNNLTFNYIQYIKSDIQEFLKSMKMSQIKSIDGNYVHCYQNLQKKSQSEVLVIDGFFMIQDKRKTGTIYFDENIINSFHGYDIDFSLTLLNKSKKKIMVVYDIDVVHYSEGNIDKKWIETLVAVFDKWQGSLPLHLENHSEKNINVHHNNAVFEIGRQMYRLGYSSETMRNVIKKYGVYNEFNRKRKVYYFLKFFLFISPKLMYSLITVIEKQRSLYK